jgi:hypothetical protein
MRSRRGQEKKEAGEELVPPCLQRFSYLVPAGAAVPGAAVPGAAVPGAAVPGVVAPPAFGTAPPVGSKLVALSMVGLKFVGAGVTLPPPHPANATAQIGTRHVNHRRTHFMKSVLVEMDLSLWNCRVRLVLFISLRIVNAGINVAIASIGVTLVTPGDARNGASRGYVLVNKSNRAVCEGKLGTVRVGASRPRPFTTNGIETIVHWGRDVGT